MNIKIGSYEAKTKLPELIRGVKAGNHYTITLRGEAVASLVPATHDRHSEHVSAVQALLTFMQQREPVSPLDFKALINEGRE